MQINLKIILLVIVGMLGFAILPIFLEALLIKEISLDYAYFLRFLFASILLVVLALPFFSWKQFIDKVYLKYFFVGLFLQGGGLYAYLLSCQALGVASATVLSYAFYIWIFLYERLFLSKKSNLGQSIGILLLFVGGIALLKFNPVLNLIGGIALIVSTMLWAFVYMYIERQQANFYITNIYYIWGITCCFALICIFKGEMLWNIAVIQHHKVFFLGFSFFCTLLPFMMNLYLIKLIGAYKLSVLSNLEQVLVLIVASFLMHAPLQPIQIFAGCLISIGVFMAIYFNRPKLVSD